MSAWPGPSLNIVDAWWCWYTAWGWMGGGDRGGGRDFHGAHDTTTT